MISRFNRRELILALLLKSVEPCLLSIVPTSEYSPFITRAIRDKVKVTQEKGDSSHIINEKMQYLQIAESQDNILPRGGLWN